MLPLYADLYVMRFLNAVIEEGLSGRLQDPGSFNWVNPDGWELRVVDWEPLVPTHGNFAGPGYSCGQRGEFSVEEIKAYPVAQVFDPVLGYRRDDYVDILAKQHDIAYKEAEGKSNYWELIKAADIALLNGMQALLDGTSPLLSDGGIPTAGELNYGKSLADAFTLKLVFADEAGLLKEKLQSSGYGLDQINGFLTSLSHLRVLVSGSGGLPDIIAPWTDLFDTSQTVVRRDPLVLDLGGYHI